MRQRPEGWLGADAGHDVRGVAVGDVTGDGKPDVVLADYERGLILIPQR
ncbi:MAG TPA: hypothetical protein VF062_04170 [Candidatus Limnocylindrales bacterium]